MVETYFCRKVVSEGIFCPLIVVYFSRKPFNFGLFSLYRGISAGSEKLIKLKFYIIFLFYFLSDTEFCVNYSPDNKAWHKSEEYWWSVVRVATADVINGWVEVEADCDCSFSFASLCFLVPICCVTKKRFCWLRGTFELQILQNRTLPSVVNSLGCSLTTVFKNTSRDSFCFGIMNLVWLSRRHVCLTLCLKSN